MSIGLIIGVVAVIGLAVGAYFLFVKKQPLAAIVGGTTSNTGWQFLYSSNTTGTPELTPEDFTFPNVDGVHYCIKAAPTGVAIGQTITISFNISGDGTLVVADPGDTLPATIRLHLEGKSGVNDRWFQHVGTDLTDGDHAVSVQLDEANWGGVGGGVTQPETFAAAVGNLLYVGFTFGGQSFAGHGVYAVGNKRFTLKSYTIA